MKLSGGDKTKWNRIKSEIVKRPFIAYSIGLTSKEITELFSNAIPTKEKIEEIDKRLIADRAKKTERLRPFLTDLVDNRGSVKFAEKVETDGMTIKYIIDGKSKKPPSYDLISRIEITLSQLTDFTVSLENLNDEKNFVPSRVDSLKLKTVDITNRLFSLTQYFNHLKAIKKIETKPKELYSSDNWQISNLKSGLKSAIHDLEEVSSKLNILIENFSNQKTEDT
jgi:hypothetical protein